MTWFKTMMVIGTALALAVAAYFMERAAAIPEAVILNVPHHGINNDPAFLVGCQAFHPPLEKKKIRPTQLIKFVNLPCALEVPPPQDVIQLARSEK